MSRVQVVRKATGKLVGQNVPERNLDLYLACLPAGAYGIEDSDGIELALATVCKGKVRVKPVVATATG